MCGGQTAPLSAAPDVDSYGAPQAPAIDSYGAPQAPAIDSYGAPAAGPVQQYNRQPQYQAGQIYRIIYVIWWLVSPVIISTYILYPLLRNACSRND